ncbi:type II toxin-antitoxin system Phd/YefM family antitoxin [Parafilimonas sp.]|uniref:type II toxin-antitoxin system Phd/YefM family antitoxin n=1 Tax=Parafilimonas sp. TaxID=1969739 RepID=UPI0039E42B92
MEVLNYTEFRNNLTESLNKVTADSEIIIVSRGKGKNVVVMSLDEYNAFKETIYLTSTKANRKRLDDALNEMEKGKFKKHKLVE